LIDVDRSSARSEDDQEDAAGLLLLLLSYRWLIEAKDQTDTHRKHLAPRYTDTDNLIIMTT
jgi:hypothetical protein